MTINKCLLYARDLIGDLSYGDRTRIVPKAQTAPECHLPDQHLSLRRPIILIQNPEVTDLLTAQKQKVSEVKLVKGEFVSTSFRLRGPIPLGQSVNELLINWNTHCPVTASTDDQISKLKSTHS
jgi:hypothetical protein